MDDIVERLKARAEQEYEMLGDIHLPLLEAAEEIERLRAALEELYSMCLRQEDFNDDRDGLTLSRARAALEQEPKP
jgi:hypothetical protein